MQNATGTINTVVTVPPWARDEPQSANDSVCQLGNSHQFDPNASVSSLSGSYPTESSRWWAFIHPLRHGHPPPRLSKLEKPQRRALSFRDRSMSWLSSSHHHRSHEANGFSHHRRDSLSARPHDWNIQASSSTPSIPFAHTQTSGWDIPWSPGVPQRSGNQMDSSVPTRDVNSENYNRDHPWETRKRQLRTFILTNNYVPLLFRFTNLTFTTAALAVAIRIRALEASFHLSETVGCSPTIVIIFAPLTLVHVMVAIYLEYFGHPLGLWRTSGKLAHTLSEVLFICAWSAALSLCFNDFFASLIPCTSSSQAAGHNQVSWPTGSRAVSRNICNHQLALIGLVGVGVIMYCTNLIISLFRIFEKIKYHPAAAVR